jgi:hypothetical protein
MAWYFLLIDQFQISDFKFQIIGFALQLFFQPSAHFYSQARCAEKQCWPRKAKAKPPPKLATQDDVFCEQPESF